jgi:hypothetical protein
MISGWVRERAAPARFRGEPLIAAGSCAATTVEAAATGTGTMITS